MPLPNLLAAMMARTRQFPEVMQLTQGRITSGRIRTYSENDPSGWRMPTYGLVYTLAAGPNFRPDRSPIRAQNVQVEAYGADLRLADELYRTLYSNFFPYAANAASGFIAANCAVISLMEMGTPIQMYDGDTDWPRVIVTLHARYSEVPTNIQFASADLSATSGV